MNPGQTKPERICYMAGYAQGIGELAIYGKDHVERELARLRRELDAVAGRNPYFDPANTPALKGMGGVEPALHGENGPDSRDAT